MVTLILICFSLTIYIFLRWWAKQEGTTPALIDHTTQIEDDDSDAQFGRETSFHFIEAAKWPI